MSDRKYREHGRGGSVLLLAAAGLAIFAVTSPARAQRVLGLDVSYWQGEITQSGWNTVFSTGNRKFVFIRSSRGGTTGLDQPQGTPGGGSTATLSHRYDDSRFVQNMVRANNAGLFTAPYHFARPDVAGNTGTDEANHFIEMAGAWMRPGYLPPMFDLEAGQAQTTPEQLAQFSVDFSNRIYAVKQIRPSIYINGNYSNDLAGASASLRNQIAQPPSNVPSVVSPAYATLVSARWPAGSGNPYNGDIQNENPKEAGGAISTFYGPWDDYGVTHPWSFWQYGSGESIPGLSDGTVDGDIAQGDIEFVKDRLIPAVWWNDSSGDWSTMLNWNSGQPVVAPIVGAGQAPLFSPTTPLPVARLPGAAGTGPTAGSNDTVILERPSANITVTLSTGTHNIRKMYMRETLNITGGSLTINYDPNYNNDFDNNPTTNFPNALRSGPISAQFSGPVTLSGTGSLSVHTLQVDATRTFTLAGSTGTLTFNRITLMPHSNSSAKILVTGDVNINPLSNATATIANGTGTGTSGFVDLGGGTRVFNVGNGTAAIDLTVDVPITNGGLTKTGAGTMRLGGNNSFAGPVTINGGVLQSGHSVGLASGSLVTVNNGGTWNMSGISDAVAGLASAAGNTSGVVTQGAATLTLSSASGTHNYGGTINGTGTLTKNGGYTQILSGSGNNLGPVNVNSGALVFNGIATTGAITVGSATLGGHGLANGAVTVNSGGHVAPGASIGTLGVAALTLQSGSILDFELGAPGVGDQLVVSGQLSLPGSGVTLNLANSGGLAAGNYNLIDYGTLSGNVAALGTPIGPAGFKYSLSDDGSLISLVVSDLLPGDFNADGIVNASDFIVWRMHESTATDLPNDNGIGGVVGQTHYDLWRAHFGETLSGGETASSLNAGVPEPASLALVMLAAAALNCTRRRTLR